MLKPIMTIFSTIRPEKGVVALALTENDFLCKNLRPKGACNTL